MSDSEFGVWDDRTRFDFAASSYSSIDFCNITVRANAFGFGAGADEDVRIRSTVWVSSKSSLNVTAPSGNCAASISATPPWL